MTWLWWLLAAYLAVGFWFGWIMLGMGEAVGRGRGRPTWAKHFQTRFRAIKQEPELLGFLLGITVGWLPGLIYIAVRDRKAL